MRVTPIQRSVFSNRRRSQTWSGNPSDSHDSHDSQKSQKDGFEKSSENNVLERVLKQSVKHKGQYFDEHLYAITK